MQPLRRYEWRCKMEKLGWLGVTQGHPQCQHSIQRIRLPFNFNRKCASILYRFQDIASYLSKVADFNPPHLHLVPLQGGPRSNFVEIFGVRKLESLGYRVVLFVRSYV